MSERLQKLISRAGLASRREGERMLLAGRVTVNGETARLGQCADPAVDDIRVDRVPLRFREQRTYLMLNKPHGYVTTLKDNFERPTVADLVADVGVRLFPVGRLDYDSDGLLLMINDGALGNALLHPSGEVKKTYRVKVSGDVEAALPRLREPFLLDGYLTRPATVVRTGSHLLDITIHEGRNRQVRRMCAETGLTVRQLTRIAIGSLELGNLQKGMWRHLTGKEVDMLRNLAGIGVIR